METISYTRLRIYARAYGGQLEERILLSIVNKQSFEPEETAFTAFELYSVCTYVKQ